MTAVLMDCREAQNCITPFIAGTLSDSDLERYLEHLSACPSCMEDLNVHYTVELGLRLLHEDDPHAEANLSHAFTEALEEASRRLTVRKRVRKLRRFLLAAGGILAGGGLIWYLLADTALFSF